ncbi:uncharacterized protein LOC133730909 [Rosa rugosa]|uniref:uncharacterized protein LOC133730909 n=1 Tax=Rosa rugosa TaxID=74645 RepID=UPI002B401C36|nr:uncharacterized protein LOC133730909 [Rosa rugosa]
MEKELVEVFEEVMKAAEPTKSCDGDAEESNSLSLGPVRDYIVYFHFMDTLGLKSNCFFESSCSWRIDMGLELTCHVQAKVNFCTKYWFSYRYLSLRLGPVSHLCTDRSFASETEDIGSSNSQEGGKFNDYSPSISKEFCFFPTKTAYDPSESTSSMWNSEGEDRSLEPTLKKRKATFRNNEEDGQFFCQPPGQPNKFPGRFTGPEWFRVYSVCTLHTMVVGKTG